MKYYILRLFKKLYHLLLKSYFICTQPIINKISIKKVKNKVINGKQINVAFFALYSSVWKYDDLYRLLLEDVKFKPIIVICPVVNKGKETMLDEINSCKQFFDNKGYKYIETYNEKTSSFNDIKTLISPDIVFYTNPYKGLIFDKYFITNFRDCLPCYVPYAFFSVDGDWVYNSLFHNICWKFFIENEYNFNLAKKQQYIKGRNIIVTGYPGCDPLRIGQKSIENIWNNSDSSVKKIIWAPHHLKIDSFINFSSFFIELANLHKSNLQIAFKPHPLLRGKLEAKDIWGKEKTETYFSLWKLQSNTFLAESEYVSLFLDSDALIHDSGSFITEYLYTGKPCFFIESDDSKKENYTGYGREAISMHYNGSTYDDVKKFINDVVFAGNDIMIKDRLLFLQKNVYPPNNLTASENIFNFLNDCFSI